MRWSDVVNLISVSIGQNDMGDITETDISRQVFANKKSIRRNEFYQAMATGLKPQLMFEVRSIDYNDEPKLTHDGKSYQIIRTYSKNGEVVELICEGLSTNG